MSSKTKCWLWMLLVIVSETSATSTLKMFGSSEGMSKMLLLGLLVLGVSGFWLLLRRPGVRQLALLACLMPILLHTQLEYPLYQSPVHWLFVLILVNLADRCPSGEQTPLPAFTAPSTRPVPCALMILACYGALLTGCAFEVVLPNAYFAASREADKASRPYSIQASVAFLSTTLDTPATGLRAVVAPFFERQVEEYRIGFTLRAQSEVVHGVVWPLLGAEDESSETLAEIEATLRACGITDLLVLDNEFPMEYCDDCGAPMYPSPEGEAVHAELPEEQAEQMPKHLH